jgi:hypothetical protein
MPKAGRAAAREQHVVAFTNAGERAFRHMFGIENRLDLG